MGGLVGTALHLDGDDVCAAALPVAQCPRRSQDGELWQDCAQLALTLCGGMGGRNGLRLSVDTDPHRRTDARQ